MSIRHIQWMQRLYKVSLIITVVFFMVLLCAMMEVVPLSPQTGNAMSVIWLGAVIISLGLTVIIRRVRCPVCRHVFIGKTSPTVFTHTCRNCGRRPGDTG